MIFKQIACRQNGTQSLAYFVENFDVSMFGDRGKSITCSVCHRVYLENYSVTCRWCNKTHVCLHRCEGSHGRCYYLNRSMWLYRNRCRDNVVLSCSFRKSRFLCFKKQPSPINKHNKHNNRIQRSAIVNDDLADSVMHMPYKQLVAGTHVMMSVLS